MRAIGDTNHPSIRNAAELQVYFWKEKKFKAISSRNFPKCMPGNCKTCPNVHNKSDGRQFRCRNRVEKFETFKSHLGQAERLLGELVAFPMDCKSLPPTSLYHKYRQYGYLHDYHNKERFFVFDIKENKFIKRERVNLGRLYSKGEYCTYCPCTRKVHSPTNLLKHLQVLEGKFYCFLIIDKPEQNDSRNQERIQAMVRSLRDCTERRSSKKPSARQFKTEPRVAYADDSEDDESLVDVMNDHSPDDYPVDEETVQKNVQNGYGYGHSDDESDGEVVDMEELDKLLILDHIEEKFKKSYDRMNGYFKQLRGRMNSSNMVKGVVDNQEKLVLSKRTEDFQSKEKELIFSMPIDLSYEDLNHLMVKYCIPDNYEISKASVSLNVQMKEALENSPDEHRQSVKIDLPNKSGVARQSSASSFGLSAFFVENPYANSTLRRSPTRNCRTENIYSDAEELDDERTSYAQNGTANGIANGIANGTVNDDQTDMPDESTANVSDSNKQLVPVDSPVKPPIRTYSRASALLAKVRIKQERDDDLSESTKRARLV